MPLPAPPPSSEVDNIFVALEQIERDLANFQNQIVPALNKFGGHLDEWALAIGQNYQKSAQEIYNRVQERTGAQRTYTYQDLNDLETADELARRGLQIQRWGVAVAKTVKLGAWAAGIFGKVQARTRVIDLIEQEKAHLPQVTALIDMGEEHVKHLLEDNEAFFKLSAGRVARTITQRKMIHRTLDQSVTTYQRLSEAQARLDYYRSVYACIAAFDRNQFQASLQQILKVGVEERQIYQLQGMSYLKMLDAILDPLTWQPSYFANGMPAGITYFLGEGKNRLPAGVHLQSMDRNLMRLQHETPKLYPPQDFYRAITYLRDQVGDIAAPFPEQVGLAKRIGPGVLIALGMVLLVLVLLATGAGAWLLAAVQPAVDALTSVLPLNTALQRFAFGYLVVLIVGAVLYLAWYYGIANHPRR